MPHSQILCLTHLCMNRAYHDSVCYDVFLKRYFLSESLAHEIMCKSQSVPTQVSTTSPKRSPRRFMPMLCKKLASVNLNCRLQNIVIFVRHVFFFKLSKFQLQSPNTTPKKLSSQPCMYPLSVTGSLRKAALQERKSS